MKRVLLWLLALLLMLAFAAAGRWQLGRALVKEAQIEQAQRVLAERQRTDWRSAPVRSQGELLWVEGQGRWHPAPVLLLDNQRRDGLVGVRVYRLFELAGRELWLVDLGWQPLPPNRQLPALDFPDSDAPVRLRGLLAPPPSAGLALGPDHQQESAQRWLLTRIELPALAEALQRPLADRVLRLDPALPMGYARDLDLLANTLTPDKHRGYALQWFGLAAAMLVLTVFMTWRHRHD